MKLYDLSPNSWFTIEDEPNVKYKFIKLDGMYSICLDEVNLIHHFAAWMPVIPYENLTT